MSLAYFTCCIALFLSGAGEDPGRLPLSDPPASAGAAAAAPEAPGGDPPAAPDGAPLVRPAAIVAAPPPATVDWSRLAGGGLRFIGVMHAFRLATEAGTRSGGFGWGRGYISSVTELHGWADGDPFYVNYVGHPMQGAVANHLWQLNDRRFKDVQFGRSRDYWKSKLRGAAFAWAFSEQFEIGPFSEASIGHIQRDFPAAGLRRPRRDPLHRPGLDSRRGRARSLRRAPH